MQVHFPKIEKFKRYFYYQKPIVKINQMSMILAKEATRVEMANDTANVVDLVQGRRYEIYPNQPAIPKQNFNLIVYV